MASGFHAARPHLAFLVGLAIALVVMWRVRDATTVAPPRLDVMKRLSVASTPLLRAPRVPSAEDLAQARIAWRYFENNYVPETGLVNAADKYPSASLWDLGSYMMAIHAARDLGIIAPALAGERLARLLDSLAKLPLCEGLPNKAYNVRTLAMVDYNNKDMPQGIGWSAIDIARLSVPLTLTVWRDPELAPRVRAVLAAWQLDKAVANGQLQGSMRGPDGKLQLVQEGRLGYEQYAAEAMDLLGLDVEQATRWDLQAAFRKVSGQTIVYDGRDPTKFAGTHNAVLSEPFLLYAFELGLGDTAAAITRSVYLAQRNRAAETGRLVAVSEDNLDRAPYFVYNTVFNEGKAWAAFTPDGADAAAHRTLSTKAAFGWGILYDDDYAGKLRARAVALGDEARGFYSGVYDADGKTNASLTANTNGIILEAIWHASRGPLLNAGRK